jgi:DNA-binding MarR family transcriptional regulator
MHAAMCRLLDLGDTDLNAMDELVQAGEPIGPMDLGNRLGIRSASTTMLLDRLEAAGHLRRERHPRDRRRITLHTTDSARAEVRATLAPLIASVDDIVARMDERDTAAVYRFLTELTEAMLRYPGGTETRPRVPDAASSSATSAAASAATSPASSAASSGTTEPAATAAGAGTTSPTGDGRDA